MTSTTTVRADEGLVQALSATSLAVILTLVLTTPFVEMSGLVAPADRVYRLYAYGLVLLLQLALVAARGWQQSLRIVATPAAAVLVWFCLSLIWAQHFELAGKRLFLVSLIYLTSLGAVCDLGYQRSLAIVRPLLALALVVNIVVVFAFPSVGTQTWNQYDLWRGIMAHKNFAGLLAAITFLVFAFDGKKVPPPLRLVVQLASLALLYQSWSRTALISALIAGAIGLGIGLAKPSERSSLLSRQSALTKGAWACLAVVLVAISVLTIERDFILSFTEDASALSLRTSIWRPLIQFYLDHPVLGSGYGAYWDATVNAESTSAYSTQKWLQEVDQGHNGYLDLLVQTGLPGLALALGAAFVWPMSRFSTITERLPQRAALIFALVSFVLIENFAESSLFADDAIANFFLFFALAQIHRFELRSDTKPARRRRKRRSAEGSLLADHNAPPAHRRL